MEQLTFTDRLIDAIRAKRSILCVGLDPQLRYMPRHMMLSARTKYGRTFQAIGDLFLQFNMAIIDAVAPFAAIIKPQFAFYEAYGSSGVWAFEQTQQYARSKGLVITDAKRGDGSDTAEAYADAHLGEVAFWGDDDPQALTTVTSPLRTDALTIHGWIGTACIQPFVERAKKFGSGVFVVDKTSFKPNSEIEQTRTASGSTNWEELASLVDKLGYGTEGKYGYRNVGVVMGATYPTDATRMREILPKAWFLIPGYGKQGGGADGAVAGINGDGLGGVVNSSRGILYAYKDMGSPDEDFASAAAQAASDARNDLNEALARAGKLNF